MGCKQSKSGTLSAKEYETALQGGSGSKVHIYKQDPSVKLGYRTAWLAEEVRKGPAVDDVIIFNDGALQEVSATDHYNNFLYDPVRQPDEFDAVNALATISRVLNMYRRALARLKVKTPLHWQWGKKPIRVLPHAGEAANAFYVRDYKALCFFYFRDPYRQQVVYTCRSHDVIAHETGHAILDSLHPTMMESKNTYTRALHESFGDLTAIFSLLDQMDMCEAVIAESKGDLHDKSFLAVIGEQFGSGIGRTYGLRNADRDVTISQVTDEYHDLSRVFTGAVYDILVEQFERTRDLSAEDPAETLYNVARHLAAVTLVAFVKVPNNAGFKEVANVMIKLESNKAFKTIIKKYFTNREVFDSKAKPKPASHDVTYMSCGTMQAASDEKIRNDLFKLLDEKHVNDNLTNFSNAHKNIACLAKVFKAVCVVIFSLLVMAYIGLYVAVAHLYPHHLV